MRITNTMLVNNMINYMGNNLSRMEKYQYQLATGKKIQLPSDDPIVATRALKFRTDVAEIEQYKRNVKDAQSWLEITEDTIGSMGDVLQRARELAVQGSNGTNTPSDTQKIMKEAEQLRNQIIHLANTTYAGRYIFTGFQTDKKLMDDNGNFITEVANTESINFEIGIGDAINVNVCGGDLLNTGGAPVTAAQTTPPSTPPGSMIDDINQFVTALSNGDHAAINTAIANFDKQMNNILRVRADVGARQNRLELTENRLESDNLNFTKLLSNNEDVDEAETIMNLKNEENVYRASLAGGARIIQPSLVDFLR